MSTAPGNFNQSGWTRRNRFGRVGAKQPRMTPLVFPSCAGGGDRNCRRDTKSTGSFASNVVARIDA